MIPQSAIIEWSNHVPWPANEQVELDLVICRSLAVSSTKYVQFIFNSGGTNAISQASLSSERE
jgi:hypothetical protein